MEPAFARMKERADYAAAWYFVLDAMHQTVLALIDTSKTEDGELAGAAVLATYAVAASRRTPRVR